LLGSLYPNLQDLRLEGNLHHQDLKFLSRLDQLQSFSFDGFSSSSPTETANVLASLENLTKLSLVSHSAMLTPENHLHSYFTANRPSLTGDVVRTINKLASFSVTERTPEFSPTLFFTPEVLASLHHHKALNSLSVSLSQAPDNEVLLSLEEFLETSSIEELELDWPDLDPLVLETYTLLPDCLKVLWVRAASAADAFEILWSVVESRGEGDFGALTKIVLVRSRSKYGGVIGDQKHGGNTGVDYSPESVSLLFFYNHWSKYIEPSVAPRLTLWWRCWTNRGKPRISKVSTTQT
jgi:hypothetical protein